MQILSKVLCMWKFVVIFADADRIAEPGQGQCGWGCIYRLAAWHAKTYEKRYSTLFLDSSKSGKFQSSSRMMQTVDVLVDMYILSAPGARALGMAVYHILREALQVCSFNEDGHSRASMSGTSKQYGSHAFSL